MRYRLRTLMIVMVVCGLVFARVAYLKQMAIYHRQKAAALIPRLAASERYTISEAQDAVAFLAAGASRIKPRVGVNYEGRYVNLESDAGRAHLVLVESNADDWQTVVTHEIMAQRYDHAVMRPWTLVSE
jgi:hypothetical protein